MRIFEGALDELHKRMIETVRNQINAFIAAGWSFVDDLIEPGETRGAICKGLALAQNKKVERPWRKHGVLPV